MCDPTFGFRRRPVRSCGREAARRGMFVALFALLLGPVLCEEAPMAQPVQCPQIPLQVTPMAGAMLLEWDQPDQSIISSLLPVDTSWGGTAKVEVRGDYEEHCDLDIRFRSVKEIQEFVRPFVEPPVLSADTLSPNYWGGTAIPVATGIPDICDNHSIVVQARGTDVLLANGTASGNPVELVWFEETDSDTITIPADYEPGVDLLPLRYGISLSFPAGTIEEFNTTNGEWQQFTIRAVSRRASLAWDYVRHGGGLSDGVSSSDEGEELLVFCNPGEWVPFKFGLDVRVVADTILSITSGEDTVGTVFDTTIVGEEVVIDTTHTIEIVYDTVQTINGFVPEASESLGTSLLLYRKIDGYRLYRANITNPNNFEVLREFLFCDSLDLPFLENDPVQYMDTDGVHNDFPYEYYVSAFDTLTGKSGFDSLKTGVVKPRSDATEDLRRIKVVPNPYKRRAAWEAGGPEVLQFTHLPAQALLSVYTVAGDLIQEWEHHDTQGGGSSSWNMRNANGDVVVSGVYLYYVKSLAPAGGERVGKFVIVR